MPPLHLAESTHIMIWKELSLLPVWPHLNEWMMMLACDPAFTELNDHYCPPLPLTEVYWRCDPATIHVPVALLLISRCFSFISLSSSPALCYMFNHRQPDSDHQITLMLASGEARFLNKILVICSSQSSFHSVITAITLAQFWEMTTHKSCIKVTAHNESIV